MPPRRVGLLLVAFVALMLLLGQRRGDDDPVPSARPVTGTVVDVVDGDTIRVHVAGGDERVRYIGIDTPESVRPGAPVECFARAAAAFNARLLDGRRVRLVADAEPRDRFGRLLAYVYREPDGLFVNAELVRRGYARTLPIAPNVRFAGRLAELARAAREDAVGLWSAC